MENPDVAPYHRFTIPDAPRFPTYPVYLALIPKRLSWQTSAFLKYGGWHSGLDPKHHVAVKRWHDCYGVELVAVMPNTVEMRVVCPRARGRARSGSPGSTTCTIVDGISALSMMPFSPCQPEMGEAAIAAIQKAVEIASSPVILRLSLRDQPS